MCIRDRFEIDESSGLPVWVQLRNRFVYLIKTGHYQPGDQLPSVRTLAAEAAINYNTCLLYTSMGACWACASRRWTGRPCSRWARARKAKARCIPYALSLKASFSGAIPRLSGDNA